MSASLVLTASDVAASLGRHLPIYRRKQPYYQAVMLNALSATWLGPHERLLDVGGGTGVIAQCISELFPVREVVAIDVVDRFCPGLAVRTCTYDGVHLPFDDGSFDAATLNNVVHHIPRDARAGVFREIARVVNGPVYIKDHVTCGPIDSARLAVLDLMGNLPFEGMVRASYLTAEDWRQLAEQSGFGIAETLGGDYRRGAFAAIFPNRLEITMRWEAP